ncbi:MAG: hypothetical protein N2253_09305, partial [Bacteroidia bacterium]|nr:hypothetical protein [Bacteroidia bacterium]
IGQIYKNQMPSPLSLWFLCPTLDEMRVIVCVPLGCPFKNLKPLISKPSLTRFTSFVPIFRIPAAHRSREAGYNPNGW